MLFYCLKQKLKEESNIRFDFLIDDELLRSSIIQHVNETLLTDVSVYYLVHRKSKEILFIFNFCSQFLQNAHIYNIML